MKELDMMHYFLGMEVWQSTDGISMGQGKYAIYILKRFRMMNYKAVTEKNSYGLGCTTIDRVTA